MRESVTNLTITLADKKMLEQARKILQCKSINALILEVMRSEYKYDFRCKDGSWTKFRGDVPSLSLFYDKGFEGFKTVQSIGMENWEAKKLLELAEENDMSRRLFILNTLIRKGMVKGMVKGDDIVSSDSETMEIIPNVTPKRDYCGF